MIRELMVWWEIKKTHTMGRYLFVTLGLKSGSSQVEDAAR